MGWFGKSFEEKVNEALDQVRGQNPGVKNLAAAVDGKVVTLTGVVPNKEAKTQVVVAFNALVETENTFNQIRIDEPAPAQAPEAQEATAAPAGIGGPEATEATERIHEVVGGDTLGAIAKKYYGKSSAYMKIFEANRDQLDNPDLIKVGQKLKIPE